MDQDGGGFRFLQPSPSGFMAGLLGSRHEVVDPEISATVALQD